MVRANFIISDIKFYCDENEITDGTEKNIAFYLIQFGKWSESEGEALFDSERLAGVKPTISLNIKRKWTMRVNKDLESLAI